MKELLALLSKNSQLAAWQWDIKRKVISVTANFLQIIHLENSLTTTISEKQMGQFFIDFFKEGQRYTLLESFRICKEEKIPFTLSFLIDFKKKGKKWLKLTAQPELKEEQLQLISGTLEDTTQFKQLQEQHLTASIINDEAPILFFLLDSKGLIISTNDYSCKKLGYAKSDLLSTNLINHITQYSKKTWKEIWKEVRSNDNYTAEVLFQRKDNTIFPARIKGHFLHQPNGSFICYYAQDIYLEQQQRLQLNKAAKTLSDIELVKQPIKKQVSKSAIKKYFPTIITQNKDYLKTLEATQKGASTDTTILILGETGTGKELLADAIHRLSGRKTQAFIKINCASLPENLIESELFGYEKGAFTGAETQKLGRFELAHKGSLFLDEIGELPLAVQAKLLRVLEDGTFEHIGGVKTIKVDVRIIAATNQNLLHLAEQGKFRKDLYYRLHIFPIQSIALQQRKEDIPLLAKHFLKTFATRYHKPNLRFSQHQLAELIRYNYPGNIRELKAIVERAVILSSTSTLSLNNAFQNPVITETMKEDFLSFEAMQRQHILLAMEKTNWRVSGERGAARLLDLNPNTLETKMRRLGIKRPK